MKILSYNPGHDGAFAYIEEGRLRFSIEAEKGSKYRHSPISVQDTFDVMGELDSFPDVLCQGGWWPEGAPRSGKVVAGYRDNDCAEVMLSKKRFLGRPIHFFSSSHERSHLVCAFGMSPLPKGSPCYVLLWEGVIGAFYEIDAEFNIKKIAEIVPEPGDLPPGSSLSLM